jgi:hypothetical protein
MPGWYTYPHLHDRMLADAPDGALFVELGVFVGKSIIGLLEKADRLGKNIRVVGVDHFAGSPEFTGANPVYFFNLPFKEAPDGFLAMAAVQNLRDYANRAQILVSDTIRAADLFANGSVYAVTVDAGHEETDVVDDITAWYSKVMPGGWIGGDDYGPGFPGVMKAVDRMLPEAFTTLSENWWLYHKPKG